MNDKTTSELLALYNNAATVLGERTVNRFADRATALKRTEAILARLPETERKPWGLQRENRYHRLHNKPNKKGSQWQRFQDAIREEADDEGVINTEAVKGRFPGITRQIWAGFWTMAKRLEIADRDGKTGNWVIEQ